MKKFLIAVFIIGLAGSSFAMSVGGPDMSIPEESAYLKQQAVNEELDRHEFNMNVRAGAEMEFIVERSLNSAEADVSKAELKGQNYMIKFSNNFYNIIEPYVKIGTSNLKVEWTQFGNSVTVEADPGFTWCMGARAILMDIEKYDVKLSLDMQYRSTDTGIDKAIVDGNTQGSTSTEKFRVDEWQLSLMCSKKYIVPLNGRDYYAIPYGGITYSMTDIDTGFTLSSTGQFYSTFNADDKNDFGLVLGFDVMPSLSSWYLLNFEMKLINELAFTFGSTLKF